MGHDAEYPYIFRENADIYFNALAVYIQEFYGAVKVKMYVAGGSAIILRHLAKGFWMFIQLMI